MRSPTAPLEPVGGDLLRAPGAAPWWFEQILIVVCATVVAWGGAGLLLAYRAEYTFGRAALLGTVGTLLGIAIAVVHRPPERERGSSRPALAMLVGAAGIAGWNSIHAGQHVVSDRDPGVYALAGKWIAAHGSLVIPAGVGWPKNVPQLALNSAGTYIGPGRTVQFQFAHFLPALLAEAHGIGGDGLMFRTNAILGAVSLLVLFAVGCRFCGRPWLVMAAVLGLAVSIPEINCVRDLFSEPSTQFVLWSGIWLLMIVMEVRGGWRNLGVALLGGAALGAAVMTRIDGIAYFTFVPLLAAVGWLARAKEGRRDLLKIYAAVAIGAIGPIVLGTLDVQHRSADYYHALHSNVLSLYAACVAMTIVSVALVVLWPRVGAIRHVIVERRSRIATIAGWCAVGGLGFAWSIRPAIQKLRWPNVRSSLPYISANSGLQKHEGLGIDGLRTYGERSVVWLSWYIGPVAVALAIIGIGFLVARLIRDPNPAIAVPLLIAGSLAAEYLWNPHVNGDQPWAMRRMIPSVLPLFALTAVAGIAVVCDMVKVARPSFNVGWVAAAAGLALFAFPLGRTAPVRDLSTDRHFPTVINRVCAAAGPHAAIVVLEPTFGLAYTQTLRDFCNVPTSGLNARVNAATLRGLARSWKAQGRTLWVVGNRSADLRAALPARTPTLLGDALSDREIEITLARPPEEYIAKGITFWGEAV